MVAAGEGTTVCVCTTTIVEAAEPDNVDGFALVVELVAWALPDSVTVT